MWTTRWLSGNISDRGEQQAPFTLPTKLVKSKALVAKLPIYFTTKTVIPQIERQADRIKKHYI
jgi:hypothetical protein